MSTVQKRECPAGTGQFAYSTYQNATKFIARGLAVKRLAKLNPQLARRAFEVHKPGSGRVLGNRVTSCCCRDAEVLLALAAKLGVML